MTHTYPSALFSTIQGAGASPNANLGSMFVGGPMAPLGADAPAHATGQLKAPLTLDAIRLELFELMKHADLVLEQSERNNTAIHDLLQGVEPAKPEDKDRGAYGCSTGSSIDMQLQQLRHLLRRISASQAYLTIMIGQDAQVEGSRK